MQINSVPLSTHECNKKLTWCDPCLPIQACAKTNENLVYMYIQCIFLLFYYIITAIRLQVAARGHRPGSLLVMPTSGTCFCTPRTSPSNRDYGRIKWPSGIVSSLNYGDGTLPKHMPHYTTRRKLRAATLPIWLISGCFWPLCLCYLYW
jgi:hypothetical protein